MKSPHSIRVGCHSVDVMVEMSSVGGEEVMYASDLEAAEVEAAARVLAELPVGGETLRSVRRILGLNRHALADRFGVSDVDVYRWENEPAPAARMVVLALQWLVAERQAALRAGS